MHLVTIPPSAAWLASRGSRDELSASSNLAVIICLDAAQVKAPRLDCRVQSGLIEPTRARGHPTDERPSHSDCTRLTTSDRWFEHRNDALDPSPSTIPYRCGHTFEVFTIPIPARMRFSSGRTCPGRTLGRWHFHRVRGSAQAPLRARPAENTQRRSLISENSPGWVRKDSGSALGRRQTQFTT